MVYGPTSSETLDVGLHGTIALCSDKHGRRGNVPQRRCRNGVLHPGHHRSRLDEFHEVSHATCSPFLAICTGVDFSTVMFVSSSAFYTQIADPVIGGTYLTLLNTVSNLGGTWPRYFVLRGVDFFTRATCILPENSELESKTPTSSKRWLTTVQSCATEPEKLACLAAEGECHKYVDGYYIVNTLCVGIAFAMFMWYIRPRVTKLQGINQLAWKIPMK